jgi:hypothetical protein
MLVRLWQPKQAVLYFHAHFTILIDAGKDEKLN